MQHFGGYNNNIFNFKIKASIVRLSWREKAVKYQRKLIKRNKFSRNHIVLIDKNLTSFCSWWAFCALIKALAARNFCWRATVESRHATGVLYEVDFRNNPPKALRTRFAAAIFQTSNKSHRELLKWQDWQLPIAGEFWKINRLKFVSICKTIQLKFVLSCILYLWKLNIVCNTQSVSCQLDNFIHCFCVGRGEMDLLFSD